MANVAGLDAFEKNQEVQVIDTSKKARIAIIGTGWIAESHVSALKKMEDVEIVALADLIPGKAEAFAKKIGIEGAKFYLSDEDLIAAEKDNLDCVSICTYNTCNFFAVAFYITHEFVCEYFAVCILFFSDLKSSYFSIIFITFFFIYGRVSYNRSNLFYDFSQIRIWR